MGVYSNSIPIFQMLSTSVTYKIIRRCSRLADRLRPLLTASSSSRFAATDGSTLIGLASSYADAFEALRGRACSVANFVAAEQDYFLISCFKDRTCGLYRMKGRYAMPASYDQVIMI